MNKWLASAVAVVLVLAAGGLARADDQEKFQGTWKPEKHVRGGMESPADELEKLQITFAGNKARPKHGDKEEKEGEFKLDEKKKPKTIDLSPPQGGPEKEVMKGIYEIDGDTLKICISMDGDRPTKFESPQGSKTMLIVLKRVKK